MITQEESYLFHKADTIPLHPVVNTHYQKNQQCIDYIAASIALDRALNWFYLDITKNQELQKELEGRATYFQDKERNLTNNPSVIKSWIVEGRHEYTRIHGRRAYPTEELAAFPIPFTGIEKEGLQIGFNSTKIDLPPEEMYQKSSKRNKLQGSWVQTDGPELLRLFGVHFAMCYTNEMIKKY